MENKDNKDFLKTALWVSVAVLGTTLLMVAFRGCGGTAEGDTALMLETLNAYRVEHGLAPLAEDPAMTGLANRQAHTCSQRGSYRPSIAGQGPLRSLGKAGVSAKSAGAAGAYGLNLDDPSDVMEIIQANPAYRAHILSPFFTRVGLGHAARICKS